MAARETVHHRPSEASAADAPAGARPDRLGDDVRFVVRCDFDAFRRYYRGAGWLEDLEETEEEIIRQDPESLIVFRLRGFVVGHAIWHGSNTREFRPGDPRDPEDTRVLEDLVGMQSEFAELHELWLKREYRGHGIGRRFFEFFEAFIRRRGFPGIVFYAFDPAAMALCRSRGYRDGPGVVSGGRVSRVFWLPFG